MPNGVPERTNQKSSSKQSRLLPLDALRGMIIVLMALDHANLFIAQQHSTGEYWGGQFPVYDDALTFLTRLVTHICAPGFFLLMGIGMVLFADSRRKQGWSEWRIIGHFIIRGVLLMALQLVIVNRAWELTPGGWGVDIYIGVLFALGGAMILGSLLLRLSPQVLLALTIVLVIGTEALVPHPDAVSQVFSPFNHILLTPGGRPPMWVNYPVLPWLELVTFGMVFGQWILRDQEWAFRRGLMLGIGFLAGFLVIRYLDGFGNIRPRAGSTWIDFLNVVKYPPSITFSLLTTGTNLILLWLFAQVGERLQPLLKPLAVFGQAPLVFYIAHLFLYVTMARLLTPDGTTIPQMLPYWLVGLLLLFPLCWWYGGFKHRQSPASILRFL
jgi:uncharacterized membrane protein